MGGMGGFGMGWGWGAFSQVEKPDSFLYSKALVDAQRDTHIPSRDRFTPTIPTRTSITSETTASSIATTSPGETRPIIAMLSLPPRVRE